MIAAYEQPKAWYGLAIETIAAYLNGRRDTTVYLALDVLERGCVTRDLSLGSTSPYYNLTLALQEEQPIIPTAVLCEWLGPTINTTGIELPWRAYHVGDWTMSLRYLIYPDEKMPQRAVFYVILLPLAAAGIICIAAAASLYQRKRPPIPE